MRKLACSKFVSHLQWHKGLPGTPNKCHKDRIHKYRPKIEPQLDVTTGALTGFDIFYHDQYYIAIHWEEEPIEDAAWKDALADFRPAALNWGINTATETTKENLVTSKTPEFKIRAWHREGSVMVLLTNSSDQNALAEIDIDIDKLGLRVTPERIWRDFTSSFALGGGPIRNVYLTDEYREKRKHEYTRGSLVYDGHQGKVVGLMEAGEKRLFSIDKY